MFSWFRLSGSGWLGQHFSDGFSLLSDEMAGEILCEERIGFRAGHCFLHVVAMFVSRPGKGEQGGRKFHLRIIAAKLDGLLDEGVAVDAMSRISRVVAEPLLVGLGEIAHVKIVESGRRIGLQGLGACGQSGEELLCGGRIFASVEGGAAKGLHVDETVGSAARIVRVSVTSLEVS